MNFENTACYEFCKNGVPVSGAPLCYLSLRKAGSMRFRWAEENNVRSQFIEKIQLKTSGKFVPVQLDHTKIVYDVKTAEDTFQKIGDGIITVNKNLIPTVTVADCVPIYLYDPVTGVFGIVHSGWKGTGIIADAIKLAEKNYGARSSDFSIVIGPHIHECCYIVNEERAMYFAENFSPDCVSELEAGVTVDWNNGNGKLYRLSLEKANLAALKKTGVSEENIYVSPDCTCCTPGEIYGSNRRETAMAKKSGRPDCFTVQAAFITF